MNRFSAARTIRSILATLLGFWIAGAGCMLGCEGMMVSAATRTNDLPANENHSLANVDSGSGCSSSQPKSQAKSHDCCKKPTAPRIAETNQPVNPAYARIEGAPSGTLGSCPLAVSRAAVVGKVRSSDTVTITTPANPSIPIFESSSFIASLSSKPRLPNRGHTYLRGCVFLI